MKGLKTLRSVETFTNEPKDKKLKFCVNCGNSAAHTAYFKVEGATIIERYCDTCIKIIEQPRDAEDSMKNEDKS
jgi:hypothetical protein